MSLFINSVVSETLITLPKSIKFSSLNVSQSPQGDFSNLPSEMCDKIFRTMIAQSNRLWRLNTFKYYLENSNRATVVRKDYYFDHVNTHRTRHGVTYLSTSFLEFKSFLSSSKAIRVYFLQFLIKNTVFHINKTVALRLFILQIGRPTLFSDPLCYIDVNVEVDITLYIDTQEDKDWTEIAEPHMSHKRDKFDRFFQLFARLPPCVKLFFRFCNYWRDFRKLRALSRTYLRPNQVSGIRFLPLPTTSNITPEQQNFLTEQTIAAITRRVLPVCTDAILNRTRQRAGCTGFNNRNP